jgi:hypothetical protein
VVPRSGRWGLSLGLGLGWPRSGGNNATIEPQCGKCFRAPFVNLTVPLQALGASAQREPNRLRGIYGAAQTAALSGDPHKGGMYYAKLVALAEKGDRARQELPQAKAYLARP